VCVWVCVRACVHGALGVMHAVALVGVQLDWRLAQAPLLFWFGESSVVFESGVTHWKGGERAHVWVGKA
jgi:hypothetical protein